MSIRAAEASDLPRIRDILNAEILSGTASWGETPRSDGEMRAWLDARTEGGFPVLVATDGGAVAGYASFGPFRPGEGYRHTVEHSVYVAAGARRRGVARALMERLIAEARARGLRRMVGGISADQGPSLALHRALGFEEQGRLTGVGCKMGRSLDLALMVLALDGAAPDASP
ncbi:N-acetyltransferase [Limibaculum sp. M0105]|uniref:N-acetyltransferase n=1 Tax=Thermohalobaculum xanthum TaxID=2753746 RepID=A0A8J7M8U3_9RHOB|nr:N-acetyltransferase [Thermohalobaculum xanthum]